MEKKSGDAVQLLGGSTNTIEEMEKNQKRNTKEQMQQGKQQQQRPTKRIKTDPTKEATLKNASKQEAGWHEKFGTDRLRYFTPSEIKNLLGFPSDHVFHASIPLKKQYALLGNSLHVGTVARLLHILLSGESMQESEKKWAFSRHVEAQDTVYSDEQSRHRLF